MFKINTTWKTKAWATQHDPTINCWWYQILEQRNQILLHWRHTSLNSCKGQIIREVSFENITIEEGMTGLEIRNFEYIGGHRWHQYSITVKRTRDNFFLCVITLRMEMGFVSIGQQPDQWSENGRMPHIVCSLLGIICYSWIINIWVSSTKIKVTKGCTIFCLRQYKKKIFQAALNIPDLQI